MCAAALTYYKFHSFKFPSYFILFLLTRLFRSGWFVVMVWSFIDADFWFASAFILASVYANGYVLCTLRFGVWEFSAEVSDISGQV